MLYRRDGVSPLTTHAQGGSHSRDVFRPVAERAGITVEAMLAQAAAATLLKPQPTLAEVASTAVFVASEQADAMTGAVANLSCGLLLDCQERQLGRTQAHGP